MVATELHSNKNNTRYREANACVRILVFLEIGIIYYNWLYKLKEEERKTERLISPREWIGLGLDKIAKKEKFDAKWSKFLYNQK